MIQFQQKNIRLLLPLLAFLISSILLFPFMLSHLYKIRNDNALMVSQWLKTNTSQVQAIHQLKKDVFFHQLLQILTKQHLLTAVQLLDENNHQIMALNTIKPLSLKTFSTPFIQQHFNQLTIYQPIQKKGKILGGVYLQLKINFWYFWLNFYLGITLLLSCLLLLLLKFSNTKQQINLLKTQQKKDNNGFDSNKLTVSQLQEQLADLTKKNQTIETQAKEKSRFLASMSHEIRTPMNGVLGLIQLIQDTSLDSHQKDLIATIHQSANDLLIIINDILDFSKIEANKLILRSTLNHLANTGQTVYNLLAPKAKSKGIDLFLHIDEKISFWLVFDTIRLQQILINLVGNAIKCTDIGEVTLSIDLIKENEFNATINISVEDTGIGIPKKDIPHLFKEFTQSNQSDIQQRGGTGLGLTISNQLIKLMGSHLHVISSEHLGSTFSFIVTFGKGTKPSNQSILTRKTVPNYDKNMNFSNKKILVVEDNIVNQKVLVGMLKKIGIQQLEITSRGDQAIKQHNQQQYDLILMDYQLPDLSGCETTEIIRRHEKNNQLNSIPIIAVTAHAMQEHKEQCLAAGMNDFLTKPIEQHLLKHVLIKWLFNNENKSPIENITQLTTRADDILDAQRLKTLQDIMEEEFSELITTYLKTAPKRVEAIKQAWLSGTLTICKNELHTLKSSSSNIGALLLTKVINDFEQHCDNKNHNMESIIHKMDDALQKTLKQLTQFLPPI